MSDFFTRCSTCCASAQSNQDVDILGDDGIPTRGRLVKCLDHRATMCVEAGITTMAVVFCSMAAQNPIYGMNTAFWTGMLIVGGISSLGLVTGFVTNCLYPESPPVSNLTLYERTGMSTYEVVDSNGSPSMYSKFRESAERLLNGSDEEYEAT